MDCRDAYTLVTLISRPPVDRPDVTPLVSSRCVLDELLADDHYRPAIMASLRLRRDQSIHRKTDVTEWQEEWWAGDIDDPAAFIRNREPKRLEW